jgi:putative DNA primase/helicase
LSLDELRAALTASKVYTSPVEDVRAAKQFVKESLYDIEPLDAGPFIEYELREHFRLKPADTKALISYHKELHKAYAVNKESRQKTDENGLPEWYEVTERGGLRFLSGLLADYLAKNTAVFYAASSFFCYQSGVYHEGEDMLASAKVREKMLPRTVSMQAINDTVGQWKMLVMKPVAEINSNPFILNLQNGLYHVLDDSFKPHMPDYYSTVQIQAAYIPDATCPLFLRYLESMLGEEEIHLVQEILGYLLIPVNKAQKSFVFVGAPNAGKSTLLNVV